MEVLAPIIAVILFVGILYAAYKSVRFSQRNLESYFRSRVVLWSVRIGVFGAAILIGGLLASLSLKWSESQILVGLPIPIASWELRDGHWLDFVSPLSIVLWVVDVVIWIGLIHLPIGVVLRMMQKRSLPSSPQ